MQEPSCAVSVVERWDSELRAEYWKAAEALPEICDQAGSRIYQQQHRNNGTSDQLRGAAGEVL